MKRIALLLAVAAALLAGLVSAAAPIGVQIDQTLAFRHLLESHDLLVLTRYRLLPASQTATDTFSSITVDGSGDVVDCCRLTNRHTYTDTTSMSVVEDAGPTTITSFCTLGADQQQVTCLGTGLGAGAHDFTITYKAGWDAYAGTDALYQLVNQSAVVVTQRTVQDTGYALVGLYVANSTEFDIFVGDGVEDTFALTRTPFYTDDTGFTVYIVGDIPTTAYTYNAGPNEVVFDDPPPIGFIFVHYPYTGGVRWGNASNLARLMGSPTLWAAPSVKTQTPTWRATGSLSATQTQLTTDLRQQLRYLESSDPAVGTGDYVDATGITDAGRTVALAAWGNITSVIPTSFLRSSFNPLTLDLATKTAVMANEVASAAAATNVGQAAGGLGSQLLGTGGAAMGMLLTAIACIAMAVLVITRKGEVGVVVGAIWLVLFGAWLIGWAPQMWFWVATALITGIGFIGLARERLLGGG